MQSRRSAVVIDRDNLEREWVEQAEKYCDAAEEAAQADFDVDEAEAKLSVVKAESEQEIRHRPTKFGLTKPVREGAVKLQITLHVRVQKYVRLLNRKKLRLNMLKAVVRALEHRKRALEKLVDMGVHEQYAAPRTKDTDAREHIHEKQMKALRKKTMKGEDDDD